MTKLKPDWNYRSNSFTSKIRLMRSLVTPISLYACESWTQSTAAKTNTSHGNDVLPLYTTNLMQRPCYQRGSLCQNPAANPITRRPPDRRREIQTEVVWACLPFIRSGQNHRARHSERGKKTRQTERGWKTTSGKGQVWSSPSPRGQWKTENDGGNWL